MFHVPVWSLPKLTHVHDQSAKSYGRPCKSFETFFIHTLNKVGSGYSGVIILMVDQYQKLCEANYMHSFWQIAGVLTISIKCRYLYHIFCMSWFVLCRVMCLGHKCLLGWGYLFTFSDASIFLPIGNNYHAFFARSFAVSIMLTRLLNCVLYFCYVSGFRTACQSNPLWQYHLIGGQGTVFCIKSLHLPVS